MKKLLTASFLTLGTILISGCSLTEQKPVDNSAMTEQITALQQQMSDFSSQMESLKQENEQLKQENNELKNTTKSESGVSITDIQNEELKKEVEKYKQTLIQEKIKNKSATIESPIKDNSSENIQKNWNKTFRDNRSMLSFEYPDKRKIIDWEYVPSNNECDPVVIKKLYSPEEPLTCFEAWCTPEITPSINFAVRNTSCKYMYKTCNSLDSWLKNACNKLVALWAPESTAAATIWIWLDNWKNYYVINGNNWKVVIWYFIDWIVQHKNWFFVKNWYIASISDSEWVYETYFDDIVKTVDF